MNIIQKQPNPSGAYPPVQSWSETAPPNTHYEITCDYSEFFNGFIIPTVEDSIVTGFVCNTELWEAWKAVEAEKVPITPEPTLEQRTTALEATQSDVIDVLASALGVTI